MHGDAGVSVRGQNVAAVTATQEAAGCVHTLMVARVASWLFTLIDVCVCDRERQLKHGEIELLYTLVACCHSCGGRCSSVPGALFCLLSHEKTTGFNQWTDPGSRETDDCDASLGRSDSQGNTCRRLVQSCPCTAARTEKSHKHLHLEEKEAKKCVC